MIFKCLNGLVPSYLSSKVIKRSETHSYCTGQSNQLNYPQCRTSAAQLSFPFRASKIKYWNSLSNDIRNSASVEVFKTSRAFTRRLLIYFNQLFINFHFHNCSSSIQIQLKIINVVFSYFVHYLA